MSAPSACFHETLAAIPDSMKAERRWLLWRYEPRPGRPPTKVPLCIDGRRASSTNPEHWTTCEVAALAGARIGADGLGFVLGGGIVGVDLDHVRDPQTGVIESQAANVIARFGSYAEASPSRAGVHVFLFGSKPAGRSNMRFADGTAFEIYDRARFFTITGEHIGGTPRDLRIVPDAVVASIHTEMLARLPVKPLAPNAAHAALAPITLGDQDVLRRMFNSRNGAQLARLYHGQHGYGSPSDADMRLCGALAFWTGRDAAQMDRLFRASGLMRGKWDSRRGETTYGAATISMALANCTVTFGGAARG